MMNKFQQILARVKQHAGKKYLIKLSPEATFALEYILYQRNAANATLAGKRTYVDGKQIRINKVQRTDIINNALLDAFKRYHEWEHNGDEDETHPAPEIEEFCTGEQCKICEQLK